MVVVGAGIAGLTVANALTGAKVECLVLEARDRIGGRLHTVDLAGTPVDLGGSWIHHPDGNPLSVVVERGRLAVHPGDPLPSIGAYDCVDHRHLTDAEVRANLALQFDDFPSALDRLRESLDVEASVDIAAKAYVRTLELSEPEARRGLSSLRAVIEADASDAWDRQSLRWYGHEIEYGGGYFGDLPEGGFRSIVQALAGGLDIRLGSEVTEVRWTSGGVEVQTAGGALERASHVVVAVPLGVLKTGSPAFHPGLPTERLDAIGRLGFGRYEKVALAFDEPFWADADLSHLILFTPEPADPAMWVIDLAAFGAGPVLLCQVFHSLTPYVAGVDPRQAAGWVLSMLQDAVGHPCPEPSAVAVTSWSTDPYALGSYTHVTPGAEPALLDLLGKPVGGRVLFAGEHTYSPRLGYADGAMSSGLRESGRLLGTPDVQLRIAGQAD